jgi:hypothetical protein
MSVYGLNALKFQLYEIVVVRPPPLVVLVPLPAIVSPTTTLS